MSSAFLLAKPISAEDRRKVLIEWNRNVAPVPDLRLHQLVERQADLFPDRTALEFAASHISFGEIERRANQLAHHLRALGARPGTSVAVYLGRSFELTIALLGVLKAGAAFIPCDTAEPAQRLVDKIADAEPLVVITIDALVERLAGASVPRVVLDGDARAIANNAETRPEVSVRADDPAYLMYTSGSTGRPKGVLIPHRGVVNRMVWFTQEFPFIPGERACHKTSFGFVDSICEIFAPLTCGVSALIVSEETASDPLRLAEELERGRIRRLLLVPTLLRALLDAERSRPGRFRELDLWLVGGERLPRDLADRFLRQMPEARLFNLYGCTEVSAEASCHQVVVGDSGDSTAIGRPIANAQLFVVDADGEPAPIGAEGEIWIGGIGVALRYHERPELDRARFVTSTWPEWPNARLYRTGDLGRFRADGTLECLGRIDDELKVHGVRIDPTEIEHVLLRYPGVREAVVTARGSDESRRLVAFVVWRGAPDPADLRRHLAQALPPWLVPTMIVDIEALPLLASGKVDRTRLPDVDRAVSRRSSRRPSTETEHRVARVWEELLELPAIGADEDFFMLGGDSLCAYQLLGRLRESVSATLTFPDLFAAPTVAAQAALVSASHTESGPPLAHVPRGGRLPLAPTQEGFWLFEEFIPDTLLYVIKRGVQLRGALVPELLERSIRAVAARHEALRTRICAEDGHPFQIVDAEVVLNHRFEDYSSLDEPARTAALARLESDWVHATFELMREPAWRTALVRVAPDEHVLLIAVHHIIIDARSIRLWFAEVIEHHNAFASSRSPDVPALPFQPVDVTAWQQQRLASGALETQRAYWLKQLAGAPRGLRLGAFGVDRANDSFEGARRLCRLPEDHVRRLRAIGRTEGATPLATFLALLAVVVGRATGEQDLIIGTPVDLRDRPELGPLIGMLVGVLALRIDLSGEPTFRELLARARDTTRGALANTGIPFEQIVTDLGVRRSMYRKQLFEVMIDLTRPEDLPSSPSLEATAIPEGAEPVPRDLVVRVRESALDVELLFEWRPRIIATELADVLFEGYLKLIEQATDDPERSISEYRLR